RFLSTISQLRHIEIYMATSKPKDSTTLVKEKKLASSNSHITHTKKTTTKPSNTSSTHDKASSTSSEKQIPNYLKSTIASRPESHSFKHVKKQNLDETPQKPTLNRRRSFDKPIPPSTSRLHKALVSPGPRERTITQRSTSFSSKSTIPSKPILEKTSKTIKDGKPSQLLLAKSAKKSTSPSTVKKVTGGLPAKNLAKAPKVSDITQDLNVENKEEVKKRANRVIEEVVKVEDDQQEGENHSEEIAKSEDTEHQHDVVDSQSDHTNIDRVEEEKVIPTVSEELEGTPVSDGQIDEAQDKQKTEETKHELAGEEKKDKDESNSNNQGEGSESDRKVAVKEEVGEEGGVLEDDGNENRNEGKTLDEKEEVDGESEGLDLKEKFVSYAEHGVEEEEQTESATSSSSSKHQGNKKESPAYNDVIEETTSKLLEQRKNKVRALVGAFETVIDYESK
ncbi:Calmodulin-binding domain, partial [Quillaja saponaria]